MLIMRTFGRSDNLLLTLREQLRLERAFHLQLLNEQRQIEEIFLQQLVNLDFRQSLAELGVM